MSSENFLRCKDAPKLNLYGFREDLFCDVLEKMAHIEFPQASISEIWNEKMPIILNALLDQMDQSVFIVSRTKICGHIIQQMKNLIFYLYFLTDPW